MDASALMDVLAAAYTGAEDDARWLEAVAEAALPLLSRGCGLHAWLVDARDPAQTRLSHPIVVGAEPQWQQRWRADWWEPFMEAARPEDIAYLHQVGACTYATEVWRASRVGAPTYADYLGHLAAHGYGETHRDYVPDGAVANGDAPRLYPDSFNLVALDATATGCALVANLSEPVRERPPMHELLQWERLCAHLAAALRLQRGRRARIDGELILEGDGRVAHAAGPAKDAAVREPLRAEMRAVEALHHGASPAPAHTLAAWRALHHARWSVFAQVDSDGRRFMVAQPNEARAIPRGRALTDREAQVVAMVAQGKSNKLIAYDLGVTVSTVGTTQSRVLLKLGLRSRAELIAWARTSPTASDTEPGQMPAELSPALREIFDRLRMGAALAEIARARGTSARTVRNQVCQLYEALGVQGRSEFLSRYAG